MPKHLPVFFIISLVLITALSLFLEAHGVLTLNWHIKENITVYMLADALILGLILVYGIYFFTERYIKSRLNTLLQNKKGDAEYIIVSQKSLNTALVCLINTLTSITEGDLKAAHQNLASFEKYSDNPLIADLLRLKIYKGEKNFEAVEKLSEKLALNPQAQLVGFKASVEALNHKKDYAKALISANKAFEARNDLYWVTEATYSLRMKNADFAGALEVLEIARKKKLIEKSKYQKFKAVTLFELANFSHKSGDDLRAVKLCFEALALDHTFVPASLFLAHYYGRPEHYNKRRALDILLKIWRISPTEEIAEYYLKFFKDTPLERVHRMEHLAVLNRQNTALNHFMLGELYLKANLWQQAKSAFELFLISNPATKKIAELIAYYEKKVNSNTEACRSWQKRQNKCLDDNIYMCSCGHIVPKWRSVCPKCGQIGKIKWYLYNPIHNFKRRK